MNKEVLIQGLIEGGQCTEKAAEAIAAVIDAYIDNQDKENSETDTIDSIGGIDAVIAYLRKKKFTTTDKIKFLEFLKDIELFK